MRWESKRFGGNRWGAGTQCFILLKGSNRAGIKAQRERLWRGSKKRRKKNSWGVGRPSGIGGVCFEQGRGWTKAP